MDTKTVTLSEAAAKRIAAIIAAEDGKKALRVAVEGGEAVGPFVLTWEHSTFGEETVDLRGLNLNGCARTASKLLNVFVASHH